MEDAGEYGLIGVVILFYLAMNAGFIGFNANIIQFGMEQLHDSPAHHQSLFIYWYVWIYYLVQFIIIHLSCEFITMLPWLAGTPIPFNPIHDVPSLWRPAHDGWDRYMILSHHAEVEGRVV